MQILAVTATLRQIMPGAAPAVAAWPTMEMMFTRESMAGELRVERLVREGEISK